MATPLVFNGNSPASGALTPVGGEFLVNTQTTFDQVIPTITGLANGGFVVTWYDFSGTLGDSSGSSVKAQLFDATGGKLGGEFLVNTQTTGFQYAPTITGLANGGFVVSWQESSGTLGDSFYGINAQVFDATGGKVGSEFLVNTQTSGPQERPNISGLANGGFVVTWWDNSGTLGDSSDSSIKAQLFDATGGKIGGEFLVNTQTSNRQEQPSVSGLANGGFVVSWWDYSGTLGDSSLTSIKAQIFDAAGARLGGEFLVNTVTAGEQYTPSVTGLANGGFVVTWYDWSATLGDNSGTSIKAQLYDAAGGKLGTEFLVNTQTAYNQFTPTVTGLANGGFVVSWYDSSGTLGDSSGYSVKAQVFDATGGKLGGEFLVNTQTTNDQMFQAITGLANGGYVVSWQDHSSTLDDSSGSSIKAQIYGFAPSTPAAPSITKLIDDVPLNTGDIAAGGLTNDATPGVVVSLTNAAAGDTLTLLLDGNVVATATTVLTAAQVQSGSTTLAAPVVGQGAHVFTATLGNAAGTSAPSAAFNFTLDTATPTATVTLTGAGTNYNFHAGETGTITISFSEAVTGLTVGDLTVTGGTPGTLDTTDNITFTTSFTPTPNAAGSGGVQVTGAYADAAGNAGAASNLTELFYNTIPAVGAVTKVGGEFLVHSPTSLDQYLSTVTGLANGGFVVTWADNSGTLGDSGSSIKAQIFRADGTKVGSEFLVNTQTADDQVQPTITGLANGGFVVSWWDFSGTLGDNSGTSIKAQIFNAVGGRIGGEFLVDTYTFGDQYEPTITGLADGGFVITWYDANATLADASGFTIKAQIFDSAGAKRGNEFLVNTFTSGDQVVPFIASLVNGGFVVTWTDYSGTLDDYDGGINAQIFNATGAKVGSEFLVNTQTDFAQYNSRIAGLANGGFVVAWTGTGGNLTDDISLTSIKAQVYNAAGARVGGELLVNTSTYLDQGEPTITGLANGGFVVSWQDSSGTLGDSFGKSIKAQAFDAAGARLGGEFLVNTLTNGNQEWPSIASQANGGFVVSWTDGSDYPYTDIKAQIYGFASTAPNAPSITGLIDDVPLLAGAIAAGGLTNDSTPGVVVSLANATAGDTLTLLLDGNSIAVASLTAADIAAGSVTLATSVGTQGPHSFTATLGNAGGTSAPSAGFAFTLDTLAPAISIPDLDPGSDTGPSSVDNITADNTPTFSGTAEAGAAINLYANAILVGSTIAAANGSWTITAATLADGPQDINATATDAAGNTTTTGYLGTRIDTASPILAFTSISDDTGASPTDFITRDTTLIFNGTISEAATLKVEQQLVGFNWVTLVEAAPVAAGVVSFGPGLPLTDGTRNFRATPTDAAGNVGTPVTLTITTDTVIATPSLPDLLAASDTGALSTDNITKLTTLDFTGTAEANSSVILKADNIALGTTTANGAGVWTLTVPVTPGAHDFNVTATDLAGNSASSGFVTMVVDTTGPILSFTSISDDTGSSATDFVTRDTTLVFNGSISEAGFLKVEQQLLPGGPWVTLATAAPVAAGAIAFGPGLPLTDGTRLFRATPTDIAGNTGDAFTLTITTDTTAPVAPVLAAIANDTDIAADRITSDHSLIFTGTAEAGSMVTLSWAGHGIIGTALANGLGAFSIDATATPLLDGVQNFTATATDLAGNTSAPSANFAVTLLAGPVNIYATNSYSQTYNGTLGNDIMFVQGNSNSLLGGYGEDRLSVYGWYNTLDGGDGNDVLIADGGFNTLHGGAGNNLMQAYGWGNVFTGGNGDNIVQGLNPGGVSTVTLGNGNNTVALTGWNNSITLGNGNNVVWTGDGNSTVTTGNGNNTIMAYGWNNVITTGTGNDAIAGGNGTATIDAGGGDDQIWLGESGGSIAYGGAGNDVFYTGGGNSDFMYGGTGNDQYVLYTPWTYVIENPGEGIDTVWAGVSGYDMAANVEIGRLFGAGVSLSGNSGNEQLVANNGGLGSTLDGGAGDDVLWGNNGADSFRGGAGNDIIYSYGGADRFIYDTPDWGADQISDFSAAQGDKLDLRGLWLPGIEALTIQSGNDTLVTYGTSSIYLYGVTSLTAADILFV